MRPTVVRHWTGGGYVGAEWSDGVVVNTTWEELRRLANPAEGGR